MVHFQSGIWIEKLSGDTDLDPHDIPCARNYKAWTKRFSAATEIPITVFVMCPKAHVHTWDSIFPDGRYSAPAKFTCDYSTSYTTKRNTPCGKPLFRDVDQHVDPEEQRRTAFKPLLVYPVFDMKAQLRSILKRPGAYEQLTAYTALQKPTVPGAKSELYHGEAFQMLIDAGLKNDDPKVLDLFLQFYLDWAQFSGFSLDKIGPFIARVGNFFFPTRYDDDKMYVFTLSHAYLCVCLSRCVFVSVCWFSCGFLCDCLCYSVFDSFCAFLKIFANFYNISGSTTSISGNFTSITRNI